ncbi:MAG: tetratricopeptide repeat protein [candidate division WOR-3 bacterium]|nr:tetratricopeptide repeat protein [candidate division WOR-3 bacterium]MDW7987314.1 tetratricopeptide repeat protein [candidate division WOR-3 bacterium]
MEILIIILLLIAILAAYPLVRDYLYKKKFLPLSYTEGLRAMLDGRIDDAINFLKDAVKVDSNNIDAYLRLAELYKKKNDNEIVAKIFERLALRRNISVEDERRLFKALGKYYFDIGRNQKAIAIYEELINIEKNNPEHYKNLFELYLRTEQWGNCEELLKKMTNFSKEILSECYVKLAKARFDKSSEDAGRYLKEALAHSRKHPEALILLGKYYYRKQETELAIKIWDEFLSYYPEKHYLVSKDLEQALYDLNRYDEIIKRYQELINRIPTDLSLYFALAQIYEKKEDLDNAINLFLRVPAEKKNEVLYKIALARLYLLRDDVGKTRYYLDQIVENYPQSIS